MNYAATPDARPIILPYRGVLPRIADDVFIAPGAAVVGDVEIGAGSSVWFGCVIRGDEESVRIGERVNLQDGTVIHVNSRKQGTVIGDDVTVGHKALLHACTLETGAYVGMGAVVMDEAVVEGGAMMAGGALLTPRNVVRRGELWAGRPARLMCEIESDEALGLASTAGLYADRAQHYLIELGDRRGGMC